MKISALMPWTPVNESQEWAIDQTLDRASGLALTSLLYAVHARASSKMGSCWPVRAAMSILRQAMPQRVIPTRCTPRGRLH